MRSSREAMPSSIMRKAVAKSPISSLRDVAGTVAKSPAATRRANPASERTGCAIPRAITMLAMIDTIAAASEIHASSRCRRRNGSIALDNGCCSTTATVSSVWAGSVAIRVIASALYIALPSSSRQAKCPAEMSRKKDARCSSASVVACNFHSLPGMRLRNDTSSRSKRPVSRANPSLTG